VSTQVPHLDKGEMTAAERGNLQLTEDIVVLMAKSLRAFAKNYPPKLREALANPNAETQVDISFGNEKSFSATLNGDHTIKKTQTNKMTEEQAQYLQEALSKEKGETLDTSKVRDMRVLVNGKSLFEVRDGKVIQNELPPDFCQAIALMIKPKPLEVSLTTNSSKPSQPQQQVPAAQNKELNGTSSSQQQLNHDLITEAKKALNRLVPDQPVGNRQWKHDKYTLTEKDGAIAVYVAETNSTIRQSGEAITGTARQKDVNALSKVNAEIARQLNQSASKGMEQEL